MGFNLIKTVSYAFLGMTLFGGTSSFAQWQGPDSVRDAFRAKQEAMNRYYLELKKLKNPSVDQRKALKRSIIEPANEKYFRAVESQRQHVLGGLGFVKPDEKLKKEALEKLAEQKNIAPITEDSKETDADAPKAASASTLSEPSSPGGRTPSRSISRPKEEEVVKGNFPRLIEFGGKEKKKK